MEVPQKSNRTEKSQEDVAAEPGRSQWFPLEFIQNTQGWDEFFPPRWTKRSAVSRYFLNSFKYVVVII